MNKKILLTVLVGTSLLTACSKSGTPTYKKDGYTSVATFVFNGGILTNSVTDIDKQIKYAYEPNTYICDPANLPRYSIFKSGYDFLGWYIDEDFTKEWNFATDKIGDEDITLYAKWGQSIKHTYTLVYSDETGNEVSIYSYDVNENKVFSDFLDKANSREDYTALGFYKDKDLTEPWDYSYEHPCGEESLDVKVYVKYIQGTFTLVSNYRELVSAKGSIYLLNDIDCENQDFKISYDYNYEFKGNNHKISNFVVKAPSSGTRLYYSIFSNLISGAKIENITFDNVTIQSPNKAINILGIAGLAGKASGDVTISNVKITNSKVVIQENLALTNQDGFKVDTDKVVASEDNLNLTIENYSANYALVDNRKTEE